MCNPIAAGGVMLVGVFFGVVYCGRLAMCDGHLVGRIMAMCAAAAAAAGAGRDTHRQRLAGRCASYC
ncbi:hypothetical protein COO20_17095 [Thalassospira marina]|uniref:Uncharacterized protein n=1 Tax=Thalassospira marina TaxID=2048283 RepID=A0A2N3KR77_9PROT|nr:hypothetical protein COO20_17095 [Thalassospira marina]